MMFVAPSLARRIGLGVLAVVLVAGVAACNSKSLVENFTSKATASDFQASGTISGTLKMTLGGATYDATISGTEKLKGNDSSQSMTTSLAATETMAATASTTDTITVGDSTYSRTDNGAWTKAARSDSDITTILAAAALADKGVETHYGQQLHRLDSTKAFDPKFIFSSSSSGLTDVKLTLTFWAKDDGTPAGMMIAGTYTQDMNGTPAAVTLSMDFQFTSLSGVTIEAPSM
jgi:hypothetical protein